MPISMGAKGLGAMLGNPALKKRCRGFNSPRLSTSSVTATGVTKDSTGAVLAGCTVDVFRVGSNEFVGTTVSDGSGNWALVIPGSQPLFARAVDAGGTVAGTTLSFTSG